MEGMAPWRLRDPPDMRKASSRISWGRLGNRGGSGSVPDSSLAGWRRGALFMVLCLFPRGGFKTDHCGEPLRQSSLPGAQQTVID